MTLKSTNCNCAEYRCLEEACRDLMAERDRLLDNKKAYEEYTVRFQRHRDAWRMYAYDKGYRPADHLDGNESLEGPTLIEKLQAENAALKERIAYFEAITTGSEHKAIDAAMREVKDDA